MVSHDRQQVIETNRSLRNIKNELESLLEKGVLSDSAFDAIHALLPAEGSLAPSRTATSPNTTNPLTSNLNKLALNDTPPSYAQSTGTTSTPPITSSKSAPPPLPGRNPPPPTPPSRPTLVNAKALYKYTAADARDVAFDKGDTIAVYEYMNDDWWMGHNLRTGEEGIFPRAYVEANPSVPVPHASSTNEKQYGAATTGAVGGGGYVGGSGSYPAPPGRVDPYNSHAPPMAMANGSGEAPSKTEENTKKFGKKLGNAAIFGAGATLGGKIVNSIF